jgi:selenide,water dikinase
MLPGHIAGLYTRDQCHIDLIRLARFAKAQIIHAEAIGVDTAQKLVHLQGRPPVHYDLLSIDTGSTPNMSDVGSTDGSAPITPVKPIDSFSVAWSRILSRVLAARETTHVVVVGGGAGGVELILSMQARIIKEREGDDGLVKFTLVSRTNTVLPNHNAHTQALMRTILRERGIEIVAGRAAVGITQGQLRFDDGTAVPVSECVWCAQASAAAWLPHTGLKLDSDGFILVGPTLQSVDHPEVFAAGDVASMRDTPRPKAGVFAVRQGPPLANNLRRLVQHDTALEAYVPQDAFLGLITTGDPRVCVASRGNMGIVGEWLFPLKDWIDRKWMAGYSTALPFMPDAPPPPAVVALAGPQALTLLQHRGMRCGGCGAKVRIMTRPFISPLSFSLSLSPSPFLFVH